MVAGAALVVAPWIARNELSVGCPVLTTDTRALWKANNENTREILDRGGWIDDVPEPPGGPPWPELAADLTLAGKPTEVDECAQQRYYRELVFDFWRENPDEKGRLAAQAVQMLWSPTFSVDSDDAGRGRLAELGRDVAEPVFMLAVYLLAIVGAVLAPRRYVALVALLVGLQHARRHGLRRDRALPRALRLPARDPRRRRTRARLGLDTRAPPATGDPLMKVLHVQRIGGIGGSERHVLELLPALRARGIDASFLGLDDTNAAPQPFYDALAEREVPFERLPCPRDLAPRLAAGVIRATRALRPDIVHTHLIHADAYGALASAPARAVLVSTKHNDDPFRSGKGRHLEKLLTRRASRVICITEALARFNRDVVGLPVRKLRVVHYGLDAPPEPWGPPGGPELPAETPVLVAVCRLVPQKGVDIAIERSRVFGRSIRQRTSSCSERGRCERELTALAAHARRRGCRQLPGAGRRRGLVASPGRRRHPSARWEGFGLALLEAMLCERAVVASNVSSIPEIVARRGDWPARPAGRLGTARRRGRLAPRRPGTCSGAGRGGRHARARGVLGRADGRANGRGLRRRRSPARADRALRSQPSSVPA